MNIIHTPLESCFLIEPTVYEDDRGYFYEKYNESIFEKFTGENGHFVQDNISKSKFGVVRGIHFQKGEYAQAKLVSCIEGKVWDVAVDLRKDSSTFGQWYGSELTAENKKSMYIPRGFGHGFAVLSDSAIFAYKCDNYYNKESEGGILWNDSELAIDWQLDAKDIVLSDKDIRLSPFSKNDFLH